MLEFTNRRWRQDCHFYRALDKPSSKTLCYSGHFPFFRFLFSKEITKTQLARQRKRTSLLHRSHSQVASCPLATEAPLEALVQDEKLPKLLFPAVSQVPAPLLHYSRLRHFFLRRNWLCDRRCAHSGTGRALFTLWRPNEEAAVC